MAVSTTTTFPRSTSTEVSSSVFSAAPSSSDENIICESLQNNLRDILCCISRKLEKQESMKLPYRLPIHGQELFFRLFEKDGLRIDVIAADLADKLRFRQVRHCGRINLGLLWGRFGIWVRLSTTVLFTNSNWKNQKINKQRWASRGDTVCIRSVRRNIADCC